MVKSEKLPLLEIKLNLVGQEVRFQPDIYEHNGKVSGNRHTQSG